MSVGDWHCPVCGCGGTKGTEDMHAAGKCEGVPMVAEQGWKVERVLDAARAWRQVGYRETGVRVDRWESVKDELCNAIDALDAPVERYTASKRDSKINARVVKIGKRIVCECYLDEDAEQIAAALNALSGVWLRWDQGRGG